MAGYENFDRQYRFAAGQGNSIGFEIGATSATYPVPLHITFSLEKSDLETQNTGKIEIWNLNDTHLAELEQPNCIISLRAGYGDVMPLIFSGYVTFVKTQPDGADKKTSIEVLDSLVAMKDTFISLSYNGVVDWKTIFDDIANQIGAAIVYSYNAQFAYVTNGYSFIGAAKDALTAGCNCCGLEWSIQNGVLQIKVPGDAINQNGYLISAETGMIGSPEKVIITNDENVADNTVGYDVEYFLNGAIDINDYVQLVSKEISGYFYVYSLQITGDNIKGDWTCKARLLELTPSVKALQIMAANQVSL